MDIYQVELNGALFEMQLDEADAERYGDKATKKSNIIEGSVEELELAIQEVEPAPADDKPAKK